MLIPLFPKGFEEKMAREAGNCYYNSAFTLEMETDVKGKLAKQPAK